MHRIGVANPTELAMLTRVMDSLATEIGIEKSSDQYDELASHLFILFEASKDEKRLITLMRRIAGVRSRGWTAQVRASASGSDSLLGHS